jgi:hypothetical protein
MFVYIYAPSPLDQNPRYLKSTGRDAIGAATTVMMGCSGELCSASISGLFNDLRCRISRRLLGLFLVELTWNVRGHDASPVNAPHVGASRIDMSGKNFRVQHTGKPNIEGKQVTNKVRLATPDNEYQLIRADLTYLDMPHHLSLHEPTQKIEFVYFPNRGMVSQVVVTKDGRTLESGRSGERRLRRCRIGSWLEQKFGAGNSADRGRWLPNDWECARTNSAVGSAVADDLGQAYGASRDASCANRGVQSTPRYTAAPLAVAADDAGQGKSGNTSDHPRFHSDDDGHGPIQRELGSGHTAKKGNHRIRAAR